MFPPGGHPESIRWSLCERIEGEDSAAVRRDATAEDRRVFGLPRPRPPGAFHNKNLYLFIAGSEPHSVRRLARCAKGAAPHQRIVAGVPLDHYSATRARNPQQGICGVWGVRVPAVFKRRRVPRRCGTNRNKRAGTRNCRIWRAECRVYTENGKAPKNLYNQLKYKGLQGFQEGYSYTLGDMLCDTDYRSFHGCECPS